MCLLAPEKLALTAYACACSEAPLVSSDRVHLHHKQHAHTVRLQSAAKLGSLPCS